MSNFHSLFQALSVCLLANCATGGPPPEADVEAVQTKANTLGPGDVVEIKVFREPDLAGTYRVDPSGTIEFPLIGEVRLMGRHPQEVAEDMQARLADGFLVDPQVTVFVRESRSQRIHVLGQVNKPGTFTYEAGMSVIQAIASAGGFTNLAAPNAVTITRVDENGNKISFEAPLAAIRAGKARNVELQPGDIVYVPEAVF
jgi:polysaccharide export outer membrane protein